MADPVGKIRKILRMKPERILKKLLSYDDVCAIGFRKYSAETFLPALCTADGKAAADGEGAPAAAGKMPALFDIVPLSRDFWYADPILFRKDGRSYLFMEAFDKKQLIGRIAVSELSDAGASAPALIICEPFHMSFPTVFSWQDGIYMLPETSADESLRLYRAAEFPHRWETAEVFRMGRKFVDTVILETGDDHFRILTCEISPDREYECRFQKFTVRAAENGKLSLSEEAQDAAFNRTQTYSLRSRNGGALIRREGKTYVSAQESTETTYGVAMNFYPYDDKTPDIAGQEAAARITPDSVRVGKLAGGEGVHSYCFDGAYEAVDLIYLEFTPAKWPRRIAGRLKV